MKKVELREVKENEKDFKYECFRAIKTFCVIIIIFGATFLLRKNYFNVIENSRFLKYYPATTYFYEDKFVDNNFQKFDIPLTQGLISYGQFKNEWNEKKFILIAQTEQPDASIIKEQNHFYFVKNGIIFLSDSEEELKNIQNRIKRKKYEIFYNKKLIKQLKTLSNKRTNTIIITDAKLINDNLANQFKNIFDILIAQGYKTNEDLTFEGKIFLKQKFKTFFGGFNLINKNFSKNDLIINKLTDKNLNLILGVKDFGLWMQMLLNLSKNFPDNQYPLTIKLIEESYGINFEKDIIRNLNGNANLYLYNNDLKYQPLITIETKQDLMKQVLKYFSLLQISNKSKIIDKKIDNETFKIIDSSVYPNKLSFGTVDDKLFILGNPKLVENYLQKHYSDSIKKTCDFYIYTNLSKQNNLNEISNIDLLNEYQNVEIEINLSSSILFKGILRK